MIAFRKGFVGRMRRKEASETVRDNENKTCLNSFRFFPPVSCIGYLIRAGDHGTRCLMTALIFGMEKPKTS